MKIAFESISINTHIKDKIGFFDIDEDASFKIQNTYISFSGAIDENSKNIQFSTLEGLFAPDF